MNWLLGNEWLGPLGDIGKIMGGVVAGMAILKAVSAWWTKGPGRRRSWAKSFRLMAPGVRPAYVESLFGEPAFEFELAHDEPGPPPRERVWKLGEDGYLVTWSSKRQVLAYSLTTRAKGFAPKIRIGAVWGGSGPSSVVRLGRTPLEDIGAKEDWTPETVASWVGARRAEYYETYYAGNPGHYTRWACGVSQAGYGTAAGAVERLGPDGSAFLDWADRGRLEPEQRESLDRFRTEATVNSLMIIGPAGAAELLGEMPRSGPDLDAVRTLTKAPGAWGRWKHRRELKALTGEQPQSRRFARPRPGRGE
ncbi:ETEC_3214 domain-containing protein [Streptomyces sp. NPDC057638]|uniref:ETEC_3214 domain-containing protein n=1 Tax=Streptomyces sp. NPDC057638 TaxID=3346190 RepID=UPI003687DB01